MEEILIRSMRKEDWPRVREIYGQGIAEGRSTFQTQCPEYEEWDQKHLRECRFVAECSGEVVGFAVIAPTSAREVYRGVVEESIYIDSAYRGKGVGKKLLSTLCEACEKEDFWCICTSIFAINEASLRLHRSCGFREIGYRERIARDRFGNWQNTVMFERRKAEEP